MAELLEENEIGLWAESNYGHNIWANKIAVKVVLKGYRIRRALASARTLCPFPEYCPVFHKG
jgi:hypothetical protein